MGYIVNNCPGIYKSGNKPALCVEHNYRCDLVEDCLIKKIIVLCEQELKPIRQWTEKGTCVRMENGKLVFEKECDTICAEYSKGKYLAENILKLLDKEQG